MMLQSTKLTSNKNLQLKVRTMLHTSQKQAIEIHSEEEPTYSLLATQAWSNDNNFIEATEDNCQIDNNSPKVPCIACCYNENTGQFDSQLLRASGLRKTTLMKVGTHAFVKCYGEDFLRATLLATPWTKGCGHPSLANETPVLYAGEFEINDDQKLVKWSNLSGTYKCPVKTAIQSGLPLDVFYEWQDAKE